MAGGTILWRAAARQGGWKGAVDISVVLLRVRLSEYGRRFCAPVIVRIGAEVAATCVGGAIHLE